MDQQTKPPASLVPAVAAGLGAALVGGAAWGLIVKITGYEVGVIAWGIGFVAGTAVVFATRGAKGPELQAIAIASALVGILLGKYLSFAFDVQDQAEELGFTIGLFSSEMFRIFRENLGDAFGLFDLLWVGLAVVTAWRVPQVVAHEPAAPAE